MEWQKGRFSPADHLEKGLAAGRATANRLQLGLDLRWFDERIHKFAELSNETAGEHFTPRKVIRLMVNLLFVEDDEALTKPGVVRSLYDPTADTGEITVNPVYGTWNAPATCPIAKEGARANP